MTLEDRAWAIYLQALGKFSGYKEMERLAKNCFEVASDFERAAEKYREQYREKTRDSELFENF